MQASISNRQREVPVRVRRLRSQLERALPLLPRPLPAGLDALEIVLLDRATMAQVHGNFLGDATVTDVITFPYGEILICPAVAWETAAVNGLSMPEELLLYALHGVLHLAGFDDKTPDGAEEMAAAQEKLLREVLAAS